MKLGGLMIRTERLLLRRWRESDRLPWARLCADVRVMRYFPAVLSRGEADRLLDRFDAVFDNHEYGPWALEHLDSKRFIGFVGLVPVEHEAHFTPAIEIGWRLAFDAWGHGFASEAASRVLREAFDSFALNEVVSLTAVSNIRSRQVMERIKMTHDAADDFFHPLLPQDHPLSRHVLYRKQR